MINIGKDSAALPVNSADVQDDIALCRLSLHSLPVGVFTVNSKLKITSFNPRAEEVTGYSAKEAIGRFCGNILHGDVIKIGREVVIWVPGAVEPGDYLSGRETDDIINSWEAGEVRPCCESPLCALIVPAVAFFATPGDGSAACVGGLLRPKGMIAVRRG